jgi:hypothetical protein
MEVADTVVALISMFGGELAAARRLMSRLSPRFPQHHIVAVRDTVVKAGLTGTAGGLRVPAVPAAHARRLGHGAVRVERRRRGCVRQTRGS